MGARINPLFIGKEHLNVEGRSIKHPALIKQFTPVNPNKLKDEPIKLIGIDIETNHLTAEMRLLGVYLKNTYRYFTNDFLETLYAYIKWADKNKYAIAYWNRLDPFVLFKLFLEKVEDVKYHMERWGKVGGKWSRKEMEWEIQPVIEIEMSDGNFFGIKNVIRSCIQFFTREKDSMYINTVWSFDIASLYFNNIETEAKRFSYYSKIDKSAHLVDWDRFEVDSNYRNNFVLKSNEMDARVVKDLGYLIQQEFFNIFGSYPTTLISQGGLARSAIIADIKNYWKDKANDDVVVDDIQSINLIYHLDKWKNKFGSDAVKDLFSLSCEAYSGGMIETYEYGYSKKGFYADIASAYPGVIAGLWDLRDAKLEKGKGKPKKREFTYTFIRGLVTIPESIQYHPLTVKHWVYLDTNIRACGTYKASYMLEERDFLERLGATFQNEEWVSVITTGKLSSLARVTKNLYQKRIMLKKAGNSLEQLVKTILASIYGITYEATDLFEEDENLEVTKMGYRGGEFFNPIYASVITCQTRILLSKACVGVAEKGGKPILAMTDCLYYEGTKEMFPRDLWKPGKELGWFEEPSEYRDMICLGAGRYEYYDTKGNYYSKQRGLNLKPEVKEEEAEVEETFTWKKTLEKMKKDNTAKLNIKARVLVSVGMVLHNYDYSFKDLGLIHEVNREVDIVVGITKRWFDSSKMTVDRLLKGLIGTRSHIFEKGMFGNNQYNDQTLPFLRLQMKNEWYTVQDNKNDTTKKWLVENRDKKTRNELNREHYLYLTETLGYPPELAKKKRKY